MYALILKRMHKCFGNTCQQPQLVKAHLEPEAVFIITPIFAITQCGKLLISSIHKFYTNNFKLIWSYVVHFCFDSERIPKVVIGRALNFDFVLIRSKDYFVLIKSALLILF